MTPHEETDALCARIAALEQQVATLTRERDGARTNFATLTETIAAAEKARAASTHCDKCVSAQAEIERLRIAWRAFAEAIGFEPGEPNFRHRIIAEARRLRGLAPQNTQTELHSAISARDAAIAREAGVREALDELQSAASEQNHTLQSDGWHEKEIKSPGVIWPETMQTDYTLRWSKAGARKEQWDRVEKAIAAAIKALSTPGPSLASVRAEAVRIRRVRQKHAKGCVVACLAMLTGDAYDDVAAAFPIDLNENGVHWAGAESYLADRGFALLRKCQYWGYPGSPARKPWPCEPFADVHICCVFVTPTSPITHYVVMLRDGTVIDPLADAPMRLTDYDRVANITGVYRAHADSLDAGERQAGGGE